MKEALEKITGLTKMHLPIVGQRMIWNDSESREDRGNKILDIATLSGYQLWLYGSVKILLESYF